MNFIRFALQLINKIKFITNIHVVSITTIAAVVIKREYSYYNLVTIFRFAAASKKIVVLFITRPQQQLQLKLQQQQPFIH